MQDRLTGAARDALSSASEQARLLHHAHVGPEHLVLAFLDEGDKTAAASVLTRAGVTRASVLELVAASLGGDFQIRGVEPTPNGQLRTVTARALREALGAGSRYIATEHLLLGILADRRNLGADILNQLGLTADLAREQFGLRALGVDPDRELADDVAYLSKENSALRAAVAEMRPVFDRAVRDAAQGGDSVEREHAERLVGRIVAGEFGEPRRLG